MTDPRVRRELGVAVVLCVLGGGLLLLAAGRPWTDVVVRQGLPLPVVRVRPAGRDLSGVPGALGLVGLAAVVALAATRRRGRMVIGVLLAAAGLCGALVSLRLAVELPAAVADSHGLAEQLGRQVVLHADPHPTAWPYLSAAGAVLLLAGGVLTALRGRQWTVLSARYDAPTSQRPERAKDPALSAWEALDRGEDPT